MRTLRTQPDRAHGAAAVYAPAQVLVAHSMGSANHGMQCVALIVQISTITSHLQQRWRLPKLRACRLRSQRGQNIRLGPDMQYEYSVGVPDQTWVPFISSPRFSTADRPTVRNRLRFER